MVKVLQLELSSHDLIKRIYVLCRIMNKSVIAVKLEGAVVYYQWYGSEKTSNHYIIALFVHVGLKEHGATSMALRALNRMHVYCLFKIRMSIHLYVSGCGVRTWIKISGLVSCQNRSGFTKFNNITMACHSMSSSHLLNASKLLSWLSGSCTSRCY